MMIEHQKWISRVPAGWRSATVGFLGFFVFSGIVAGQDIPVALPTPLPQPPAAVGARLKMQLPATYESAAGDSHQTGLGATAIDGMRSAPATNSTGARVITLQEAQQKAASTDPNPLIRLGQLQVEVARQARLATISTFFPQIGSHFENFHFNKFMGQLLEVRRPLIGTTATIGIPLLGQNQTFVAVTATQPLTPLFQLRELYKINLADERIAKAKAGMPVSEKASKVERVFYELLIAQRQLAFTKAKAIETGNKWLVASNSATPVASGSDDEELIETSNALAIATTKVKELTASLDELLGLPPATELQIVPPDPRFEDISLNEATAKALEANPEVIEAEQTLVKARAASTIQKLSYVPVVAAMGGYAYNNNVLPLLPLDFSFVGVVATYNLFDFGKREHTIKGANAQAEMAELALQLTKAKVAASVKNSIFELERSRQLSELTRRLGTAIQLQRVSYDENSADTKAAKQAKVEAEMFQADLDYRQALARLKTLMGEP